MIHISQSDATKIDERLVAALDAMGCENDRLADNYTLSAARMLGRAIAKAHFKSGIPWSGIGDEHRTILDRFAPADDLYPNEVEESAEAEYAKLSAQGR